jgi:predicted phage baseplate assembly protein
MKSSELCRDHQDRRRDIRNPNNASGGRDLNGIDYLEVDERQTILTVYFIAQAPADISKNNVRIDGGIRIRNIQVKEIHRCNPDDPRVDGCLQVEVDRPGDFSTYTLRLVNTDARGRPGDDPLEGFDPRYAQLDFSFKANCPTDLDCAPANTCPPPILDEPEINYLGKDYNSFRQLILDRLSLIMPDWTERHVPDLGITLVELLAYVGDYLSYYQDAVATEAYLETARQRISVRRHAKLVDYQMHEGCNARAWVHVRVQEDANDKAPWDKAENVYFISSTDRSFPEVLSSEDLRDVPFNDYEVFEPVVQDPTRPLEFYVKHNDISFYTWHERECCLAGGVTSATLKDEWVVEPKDPKTHDTGDDYEEQSATYGQLEEKYSSRGQKRVATRGTKKPDRRNRYAEPEPHVPTPPRSRQLRLKAGDVLIFEEMFGPVTGVPADADPLHRHVVRLTRVEPGVDVLYDQPILEIEWAAEDALPFPLCISAIGRGPECLYREDISLAHGNVLLVDHGRRLGSTETFEVPTATEEDAGCLAAGEPRDTLLRAGEIQHRLERQPLTYAAPFPTPASVARQQFHLLWQLMTRTRARIERLWREIRTGRVLTDEETAELSTIFGADALPQVGSLDSDEQAKLIERLLQHEDRRLAKKARRVQSLAARAMAGYVLGQFEEDELAAMFGGRLLEDFGLRGSQLLGPAAIALMQDARAALPCVSLREENIGGEAAQQTFATWLPKSDLLESTGQDRDFIVEIDNEGFGHLRFGDGDRGRAPIPETKLIPTYRVGNGPRGNVGAEAISHVVFRDLVSGINVRARNPLPAVGGLDAEPLAEAKLFAPMTFRGQLERAVTRDDYALLAQQSSPTRIQQAAGAPLRWTGSWYEVQVAIDPFDSEDLDQDLREVIEGSLYRYRRIGHDLRVQPAKYVPLDIVLTVCVLPHYLRAHVEADLLDLFSNRLLPAGKAAFFHPNNLSFGEGVYLSKLVAAAQAVTGVETVRVSRLQRLYEGPNNEIQTGVLPLSPLEVARLDNDRSLPEHGKLRLDIKGGR